MVARALENIFITSLKQSNESLLAKRYKVLLTKICFATRNECILFLAAFIARVLYHELREAITAELSSVKYLRKYPLLNITYITRNKVQLENH